MGNQIVIRRRFRSFSVAAITTLFIFGAISSEATSLHPVRGKNGLVTSSSRIASEVGVDILRQGGNAVDAAIATALAMAVTPVNSEASFL